MATVLCVGTENFYSRYVLLQSAGYNAVVATNKRAAIAVCRSIATVAVILDSRLTIDPAWLACELKKVNHKLPVVLVSNWGIDDIPIPLEGVDRIICRLEPAELLQTLRELSAT